MREHVRMVHVDSGGVRLDKTLLFLTLFGGNRAACYKAARQLAVRCSSRLHLNGRHGQNARQRSAGKEMRPERPRKGRGQGNAEVRGPHCTDTQISSSTAQPASQNWALASLCVEIRNCSAKRAIFEGEEQEEAESQPALCRKSIERELS